MLKTVVQWFWCCVETIGSSGEPKEVDLEDLDFRNGSNGSAIKVSDCSPRGPRGCHELTEDCFPQSFTLQIIGVRGLRSPDWLKDTKRSLCYCKCKVQDRWLVQTRQVLTEFHSLWMLVQEIQGISIGEDLEFEVIQKDIDTKAECVVGRTTLRGSCWEDCGFHGELPLESEDGFQAFLVVKIKLPHSDEVLADPITSFTAHLTAQKALGFKTDHSTSGLLKITELLNEESAVQLYNSHLPPALRVKVGDFIGAVNSARTGSEMQSLLDSGGTLALLIQRPTSFSVQLSRGTESWGLVLEKLEAASSLSILSVGTGPVEAWNRAHPFVALRPGDRITAVNGQSGSSAELLELFSQAAFVKVQILRALPTSHALWWM